ncbi:MAG TPA: DUF3866 family protein, partial [Actinomycetota bacterium]|nr:DUF3866 family protein [Actinomycetota bacterium]
MPKFETGVVSAIVGTRPGLIRAKAKVGRRVREITAFTDVIGDIGVGDRVLINTTGVDLDLGTGGQDFVVWNLERDKGGSLSGGHILKLRYTPWQIDTMVAEAPESQHHASLQSATSLDGMPVVACGLHSQIAPVAAMLKHLDPDLRIGYIMTDGAALPLRHSDLVVTLKEKGLI